MDDIKFGYDKKDNEIKFVTIIDKTHILKKLVKKRESGSFSKVNLVSHASFFNYGQS
jgi:hypothetical protein